MKYSNYELNEGNTSTYNIPKFITSENILTQHFFATKHLAEYEFPFQIITAKKQIHSADINYINSANYNENFYCDGFVINRDSFDNTKKVNYGIGIRTADCVPILFADETNGVYGAAHSGWRGTIGTPQRLSHPDIPGIAAETVRIMCLKGAQYNNINVAVGPCIHSCCFEVRDDFYSTVLNSIGSNITEKYVIPNIDCKTSNEKRYHADLIGINIDLLLQIGIRPNNIFVSNICTCCHSDVFHSFRAEKKLNGVMTSAIAFSTKL